MPAGSRCAPNPNQVSQSQPLLSHAERGEWALVLREFRSFVQAARAPPAPHPRPARAHATALLRRL
jgi:hypothetical protein